jgi:hypothetical protein
MAYDRFLIAPINEGLETDLRPFLVPDDAWTELNNAYLFRGRLRKRFGSAYSGATALNSQLRLPLGATAGGILNSGLVTDPVTHVATFFDAVYPDQFTKGQIFSAGNIILTVFDGTPGVHLMNSTDPAVVADFDTATGNYNLNFGGAFPVTQVYFYPSAPVMGLTQFSTGSINNEPAYAFDPYFAYAYNGSWEWIGPQAGAQWHGDDTNFFWCTNWVGLAANNRALFVSNFQVDDPNGAIVATDDPLRYYDGALWHDFYPAFQPSGGLHAASPYVATARIILPFKDRLLLLNTIETNVAQTAQTAHPNRVRFCHNGSPLANNAWYEPNQRDSDPVVLPDVIANHLSDGGGWIDATTDEEIVSAEFIKDRLIVYFERSTWELVYTGNQVQPFVWQKINTELGSQATFSTVPFDKVVLTIGNTGIHACNGANVERIDNKIPDEIFKIKDKLDGVARIAGIRDYFTEMVYWAFPPSNRAATTSFPDRVLVYNYANNSFAFNDDSFTAFGYFEQQTGPTWASSAPLTWEMAAFAWDSGVTQPQFRQVIAGNQQGFISVLFPDIPTNASVLNVTDMQMALGLPVLTIINHNLKDDDYILVTDTQGGSGLDGFIYQIGVIDADRIAIQDDGVVLTLPYLGGATVARVSKIAITSKEWNPYLGKARNFYLAKIDFAVLKTTSGEVAIQYYPASSKLNLAQAGMANGVAVGSFELETFPYALVPLEAAQERLWHPVYFQGDGEFVQISITMNDRQMHSIAATSSPFELEALVLYTQATSSRLE